MAQNNRLRARSRGLRARAWWVLRKNKQMTLLDIRQSVCVGDEKNADTNLRLWLNRLIGAGIVTRQRIEDGKLTSNGSYLYSLVNDLGPNPPIIRTDGKTVYDPNSKTELAAVESMREAVNE